MMWKAMLLSCLLLVVASSPSLAQFWCWHADWITYSVADGTVTVTHNQALYNCCPARFDYDITQQGNEINVVEVEILEEPCACLCCYNLPVQIGPLPSGQYQIAFNWQDYDESGSRQVILQVEVPAGRSSGGVMAQTVSRLPSGCIHERPADVPPEPPSEPVPASGRQASAAILCSILPNPAWQEVTIEYQVIRGGAICLDVFSAGGAKVRSLGEGIAAAGRYIAIWDRADDRGVPVPAGVYFCRLGGAGGSEHRRVVVVP